MILGSCPQEINCTSCRTLGFNQLKIIKGRFWKFGVISQVLLLNTFKRTVYISVRAVSFQEMDRTKFFF
jgi:hypothetical protein